MMCLLSLGAVACLRTCPEPRLGDDLFAKYSTCSRLGFGLGLQLILLRILIHAFAAMTASFLQHSRGHSLLPTLALDFFC